MTMNDESRERMPADKGLNYAPNRHRPAGRRIRRIAYLVCALVIVYAVWHLGLPFFKQARYLNIQRKCLSYLQPPSMVVYEEDPAAAAALLASGRDYRPVPASGPPAPPGKAPCAAHVPSSLNDL